MSLSILYRGPLSSCNYDCHYCPFAKHEESEQELTVDREALERFVDWCEDPARCLGAEANATSGDPPPTLSVFFTPWGEAMTRKWYWSAFERLTSLSYVSRVAVQTNLSAGLAWIQRCDRSKIGLWCTFHPSQTTRERFLQQVMRLQSLGVSFSVGAVGLKEDFDEIERLRTDLPESVYLWINAYKREADYYSAEDIERMERVDPHFATNNMRHASLGQACQTGESVISVDGDGDIRRCHFVSDVIGNVYETNWGRALQPRTCPNGTCGCHIGYIHMPHLQLRDVYGPGLLERNLLGGQAVIQQIGIE